MNTEKIIQIFLYKTKLFRIQYLFLDVWDEKQYLKLR